MILKICVHTIVSVPAISAFSSGDCLSLPVAVRRVLVYPGLSGDAFFVSPSIAKDFHKKEKILEN
jgi:hypothetical protein